MRSLAKYQGGWVQVILFIVSLIISIVLAPKPQTPRAAALEDFDIPLAEEDRPIPVLFGTKRITGANVLWYGDLRVQPIKKSSTFGGSQTIGFKYFLGMHMGFCLGPIDNFQKIEAGDKEAWTGLAEENQPINVWRQDMFGGDKREGGLLGDVDLMFGEEDQAPNAYLDNRIDGPMPAFRGIAGLVFRGSNFFGAFTPVKFGGRGGGAYVGTTPYVKAWAVTCCRILKGWDGGTPWYPEKAEIGDGAMNPAHIIYQCITDPEWGQGSPVSLIDEDNFIEVADALYDEGLGLNMLWNQSTTVQDFIQVVMDHIAGILAFDASTGKYLIRLVRGDYDVAALQTFRPGVIKQVTDFQRRSWGETVNELTIAFTDRATRKATTLTVQDLGNIRAQGVRIPEKIDRTAIDDPDQIRVVAGRELASRSTPLAKMDFEINRIAWPYGPGSVVIIEWPEYELAPTVFRIISMGKGNLKEGTINVRAVEDIYALGGIEYTEDQTPDDIVPIPENPAEPPDAGQTVLSTTLTAPPASGTVDGDRYLVRTPATGAWTGHEGQIAEWDEENDEWIFSAAPNGTTIYAEDEGRHVVVNGSGDPEDAPWSPSIPSVDVYPGSTIDSADTILLGYSLADQAYYQISVDMLPSGGGGGASDAIDVTFDPTGTSLAATDVQNALEELDGDVAIIAGDVVTVAASVAAIVADYGAANGLAELDGAGKVPIAQLPDTVVGAVDYQGTWNATTNTPNLAGSSPSKGDYFVVSVAGSTSLGGIASWDVNDWAIYNGAAWEKVDNSNGTGAVTSVAGKTGVVTLVTADITDAGVASGAATLNAGGRLDIGQQTLLVPVADATTTRTIQVADYFTITRFSNGSAIALTVPANATLAVPIGMVCGYRVVGAGMVTVGGAGGVTVNVPTGKTPVSSGTGAFIALHKVGTNEWDLSGNLA